MRFSMKHEQLLTIFIFGCFFFVQILACFDGYEEKSAHQQSVLLKFIAPILDKPYPLIVCHLQTSGGHNYLQKNSLLYAIL